ncbi:cubilin-like [Saccoglossus kowalevskii]|uniref:Cubilin-like n=1 Tax=Saccoglossus kowalevskii TaxID=10224 RepID=A0ABM0GIU8_SACKO|nr:PREDICTED: cubilin-like [Saccoglossus kowalevskii]
MSSFCISAILWGFVFLPIPAWYSKVAAADDVKRKQGQHNSNQCDAILSGYSGEFTSPNYPDNYPSDQDCYYTITVPTGMLVRLEFDFLSIETENDYIKVYDGPSSQNILIGLYSGSTIPTVRLSLGTVIEAHFHSDDFREFQGFAARFTAVDDHCGGSFLADMGIFTSPNYPENYDDNMDCYYFISVSEGKTIQIQFNEFNLEDVCCDKVDIYDGDTMSAALLGSYKGTSVPPIITSSSSDIIVHLTSDHSKTNKGFDAIYTSKSEDVSVCSSPQTTNLGGLIYSHDTYPRDYPALSTCRLSIHPLGVYDQVYLKFLDVDLYIAADNGECYEGDVIILLYRSEPVLHAICHGNGTGVSYTDSLGITIEMSFTNLVVTSEYRGFKAIYSLYYEKDTISQSCLHGHDFLCSNYRCISDSLRCNNYDNCGDNSDEDNCSTSYLVIAIAGGGGVLLIGIIIIVTCLLCCRSSRHASSANASNTRAHPVDNERTNETPEYGRPATAPALSVDESNPPFNPLYNQQYSDSVYVNPATGQAYHRQKEPPPPYSVDGSLPAVVQTLPALT